MPLRTDGLYLDELTTDPTLLNPGDLWYNSTDGKLKYYDGNSVIILPSDSGFDPARTILVAKSGTNYSTVGAAITAASALTPTATNPVAILVYPGLYTEAALTLPEYVSLIGVGYAGSTILVPSVVDAPFLTLSGSQLVNGFLFSGATGTDGIAVQLVTAAKTATLIGCSVKNCQVGFYVGAAGAILNCDICTADASSVNYIETAFYCAGGATMNVLGGQVTGDATTLVTYGYRCENTSSKMKVKGSYANYATHGVYATDDGVIEGSAGECDNCTTAVEMVSTTPNTEISLTGFEINSSSIWDIDLSAATDGVFNFSGIADEEKIVIEDNFSNYALSFLNRDELHRGHEILGTLSVGSKTHPSKSFFGRGSPYFKGVVVLSNNNGEVGTWVDNTDAARSTSGSTFSVLQNGAVDNCAYFGADEPFVGLEYSITAAMVPGTGLIIGEYWDGGAWVQFRTMSYRADYPYTQYGIAAFVRITDHEHMNFASICDNMQTKLLNGYTKYWARLRVTSAITSGPVAEWARALPSSLYVDPFGRTIRAGRAREYRTIPWHRNLMDPITGNTPGNTNLLISANISLAASYSAFTNNAVDAKGGVILVPEGLDTSDSVTLTLSWYCDNGTGNVELEVVHSNLKDGDLINGSLPDTTLSQILTVPAVPYTLVSTQFQIPVYDLLPGYRKAIKVFRDATGGNPDDTSSGDVILLDATLTGTFWR